jgi:hypothetical protein
MDDSWVTLSSSEMCYTRWAYSIEIPVFQTTSKHSYNIIFINCKWVGTRWQWLFYTYTECDIDYY